MRSTLFLLATSGFAVVSSMQGMFYPVRSVNGGSLGPDLRIYGGRQALEGQFPFMIFVLIAAENRYAYCSASLIAPEWVLLAAHCFEANPSEDDVTLVGGKANLTDFLTDLFTSNSGEIDPSPAGLQKREARELHVHPSFDPVALLHDVALARATAPFVLTPGSVSVAPLAVEKMTHRRSCTILGWGLTDHDVHSSLLMFVEDVGVSTVELGCKEKTEGPIICLDTSGGEICQGDSGSPLLCEGKVWGVASHLVSNEDVDCGGALEEYYAELHPELPWITSTIRSSAPVPRPGALGLAVALWAAGTRILV